jgi:hypothetical protein
MPIHDLFRRTGGRVSPLIVVAVLPVVALLLVGCGSDDSPGVATASNSSDQPKATTTTPADQEQQALQFTKCMRENGVDMADPTVDTDGNLRWQPPDMSGSSQAELQKARDACQQYLQGVCCIERSEVIFTGNLTAGSPSECLQPVLTRSRSTHLRAPSAVPTANLPAKITCDRSMQQSLRG